jgi:magnesium and cobalt transporter
MSEDIPSSYNPQKTWLDKLSQLLQGEPQNKQQLTDVIRSAEQNNLIDADELYMLEGVIQVSELRVRDIMIPRSQMVVVERDQGVEEFLPVLIESAHSRFPVVGESKDDIVGILLAKDLLRYCFSGKDTKLNLKDVIRPATIVPESKRLDTLLKEFRSNRNHMAVVVDEYGGVSGLVTIEDVLEQIVGEIEDEHDFEEDDERMIIERQPGVYHINALTPIEQVNSFFETELSPSDFDTLGGLVMQAFGHMPKRGESITLEPFHFKILHSDNRRIRSIQAQLGVPVSHNESSE